MSEKRQTQASGVTDVPSSLSPGTSGSTTLAEGEHVNLQIINSTVNVVAGHQINVKSPAKKNINDRNLIQICNENTMDVANIDILDDFRHEDLQQPDFEVYPQMRQVDVNDYYKGRYVHTQLTKEVGFLRQDRIQAKNIEIEDVVASIWKKKKLFSSKAVGVTGIVASAGSGKSTLTRRIARQALGILPTIKQNDDPSYYGKKMVHFIELKDIEEESRIKPSKFLFGGVYENEFEEDQAFKWLDGHQFEAVLIFDGLDQASWDYTKTPRKIKKFEKASPWTVMYNILSRNILRNVKIYVASREFKVSELPAMARPETIITLNGLTVEDAHRLFAFLLKDEGENLWRKIETMSPRLLNLVSVPVFLILTAVVMGRDPSKPPPKTVTELYNRIILALRSVENIRNREQIFSIVHKLKALAFQGMKEGRVVFKETELERFGVSAEEVQDLMTKVPGSNLLSRHLIQGDFTFFFCHQSIQEYLAAIFISEMEFNEFCRFDEEYLHQERWRVVRRFVAGVAFSKEPNDLYRVSDQTKKQQVLAQSFLSQLQENTERCDNHIRVELYTAIYEADDDTLFKQHSVVDVSGISLSRDEAHIIGSLAAMNKTINTLSLSECRINDELLRIIFRCFKDPIPAKFVDLRYNNFSAKALCSVFRHGLIESLPEKLDWKAVKLTVGGAYVALENEEDVIKISGDEVEGRFNIKDSTLSFSRINTVSQLRFFVILFDAINYNEQRELLAKQDDLRKISECKLKKISKILLDCTEDNIDWSLIETSSENYQVEVLDIAVNGQISAVDYNRILKHGRAIAIFRNVHVMFFVGRENDSRKIIHTCHEKKIDYIRCIFFGGCRASLDEISSLVNKSNLKKVSLIYLVQNDMLRGDELKKAQKIANDLETELEVLGLYRETDAWQRLDYEFHERSRKERSGDKFDVDPWPHGSWTK